MKNTNSEKAVHEDKLPLCLGSIAVEWRDGFFYNA